MSPTPIERTLTVLVPESVTFPEKEALAQSVCNIADAQRIALPYGEDFAEPFYKTLKSVTNINRRNLWFAAHRWLENSKQPGGRFASLNINESILPNASKNKIEQKAMPINVYSKENESENRQSLLDAMGSNSNHLYLIGQGGIGKTTALMHIMNNAYVDKQYSEKVQIPLFVELSFAPDTYGALYEGGKSTFIRRSIYKQVRADRTIKQVTAKEVSDVDEVFSSLPYDVAVQPITDILSKTTPAPEYLLLLDGLNEVSSVTIEETGLSVVQMIMREIDLLISECPNVKVVLTSRSDESAIYNESISRLYLSGVEDSKIKDYLKSYELSKELIDEVLEDENLCETLQIPLFLTMYASLSKYDEVSTQGEILKLFFNERRRNISVYTMQERLSQVEKNVTDVASASQKKRIDADMQNFILDFILPEIAWNMERNGEFYIYPEDIEDTVEEILTSKSKISVCGMYGKALFNKYNNNSTDIKNTYITAKKIIEKMGEDMSVISERILKCCVFAFGIMQNHFGKYGFVHQHIRDYFAAIKNINTIRLSVYLYEENEKELALECMNKTFKDEPVNYTVRRFMGEYLGEHRNKPYYANEKWNYGVPTGNCDRNLIKRALDIYRGYFNGECGYGVYSLVQILKEIRKDLSGSDLSKLDFFNISFNNIYIGREKLPSNFFQSKVTANSFFSPHITHSGIICYIRYVAYSNDGENILLLLSDGELNIYNVKTFTLVASFQETTEKICCAEFYGDSDTILFVTESESFFVWNYRSNNRLNLKKGVNHIVAATVNTFANEIITSTKNNVVSIWDIKNVKCKKTLSNCVHAIHTISYSIDNNYIILSSHIGTEVLSANDYKTVNRFKGKGICQTVNNKVYIADSSNIGVLNEFGQITGCIIGHNGNINSLTISKNGDYLLSSSSDGTAKLWDTHTDGCILNESIQTFIGHTNIVKQAVFSPDGIHILTTSNDNSIRIWNIKTGLCVGQMLFVSEAVNSAQFDINDDKIISASSDGTVKIWDANKYKFINCFEIKGSTVWLAMYSSQATKIYTVSSDGVGRIWDSFTLKCIGKQHPVFSHREVHSRDNKYYLVPGPNNNVLVLNRNAPESVAELVGHTQSVNSVAWEPSNNKHIITGSADCTVKIWSSETYRCIKTLIGHKKAVNFAMYSRDGKYIVSASDDRTAMIWDAESFECIGILRGHTDSVNYASFNSVGKQIVTSSSDKTIKVWDFSFGNEIYTLYNVYGLYVTDVNFCSLHKNSILTDEQKAILKSYGAIIE
mgnify:CR=1 FL=1